MEDYHYDVFISYERDGLATRWITDHFLPHFRSWVRMEITGKCNRPSMPIFFDSSQTDPSFPHDLKQLVEGVPPGAVWDNCIRAAIRRSRCMVAIYSPPYFFSDWCNLEWQSFDERARSTGRDVLLAITFHGGPSFPARAAARMLLDFSPYALVGSALIDSRKYGEFQEAIKLLACNVAKAVRDAPSFAPWAIVEDIERPPKPPPIPVSAIRF